MARNLTPDSVRAGLLGESYSYFIRAPSPCLHLLSYQRLQLPHCLASLLLLFQLDVMPSGCRAVSVP